MITKSVFLLFLLIVWFTDETIAAINNWDKNDNARDNETLLKRRQPLVRFSKTEYPAPGTYVLNHIQTGSAIIPHHGSTIFVSPDANKTKSFITKYENGNIIGNGPQSGPSNYTARRNSTTRKPKSGQRSGNYKRRAPKHCIRCPTDKTVIAQKGLDGVLIEMPELKTCRNELVSNNHYIIETLFGTDFNFLLSQGDHQFIGKIKNKKTGNYIQTCYLKYKVIVRQCGKYYPRNRHLRVSCTMGGIYGSQCSFSCNNRGKLSHNRPVNCGDQGLWIGDNDEPDCYFNTNESPRIKRNHCELPFIENAKFSCEINDSDNNENNLNIGNGSICRIKCNTNFAIPKHLQKYSVFHCQRGEWNSTVTNVCRHL